jgi:membrane protease YdiL (CAAX protease family)
VTSLEQEAQAPARARVGAEVLIVLGLSLGQSGVYALVRLVAIATEGPVSQATATLNASRSERPWLDLTYQLLGIGFNLVPVALALFLLSAPPGAVRGVLARIGLDQARPLRDLGVGVVLAAVVGIPGLGVYALGRRLGVTPDVVASGLDAHWWTVPVLVLSAAQNALLEEVVVVAYLLDRLPRLGWSVPVVIAATAVLRGSYHLYQGVGMFAGNAAMGVLFALYYRRTGRVMPLVVAHTLLDVVAFVGYQYLGGALGLR